MPIRRIGCNWVHDIKSNSNSAESFALRPLPPPLIIRRLLFGCSAYVVDKMAVLQCEIRIRIDCEQNE